MTRLYLEREADSHHLCVEVHSSLGAGSVGVEAGVDLGCGIAHGAGKHPLMACQVGGAPEVDQSHALVATGDRIPRLLKTL